MINQINPELSIRLNGTLSDLNNEVKKLKHISEVYDEIVSLKNELSILKEEHVESSKILADHISDSLKFYTNTLTRMSTEHELIKNATLSSSDSKLELQGVTVDLVSMNDISVHIHELLELNDIILNTIRNYNTNLNDIIISLSKNQNENENLIELNKNILKINESNNSFILDLIENYNKLNLNLQQNYSSLNAETLKNYKALSVSLEEKLNTFSIKIENKFSEQAESLNMKHSILNDNFNQTINTINNKFFEFEKISIETEENIKKELNVTLLKQYKSVVSFYKKQNKIAIAINIFLYLTLLGLILLK